MAIVRLLDDGIVCRCTYNKVCVIVLCLWIACHPSLAAADTAPEATFWDYYSITNDAIRTDLSAEHLDESSLPFYDGNIPIGLNAKSSFVLSATRGGGKTCFLRHLKQEKFLQNKKVLVVEPISDPNFFDTALEAFVSNNNSGNDDAITFIAREWKEKDMIDFVISQIAYAMINNLQKFNFKQLTKADRCKLFAITCLYYPIRDIESLGSFGKLLLEKHRDNWYSQYKNIDEDSDNYRDLIQLSSEINVIEKNYTDRLKLLCYATDVGSSAKLFITTNGGTLSHIRALYDYVALLEKAGFTVVLAIDGIDKARILGLSDKISHTDAIISIYKSIKPLHNMAIWQHILLFLFIPDYPNIDIKKVLSNTANERVGFFNFNWNRAALTKYANFILDFLRKNQKINQCCKIRLVRDSSYLKYRCNNLPRSFSELVGGKECADKFFNEVSQPEQFNALLSKFIQQLDLENRTNNIKDAPFIGSKTCSTVENAINSADTSFVKKLLIFWPHHDNDMQTQCMRGDVTEYGE